MKERLYTKLSIVVIREKFEFKAEQNGNEPSPIDSFEMFHVRKDRSWPIDKAKELHAQMVSKRNELNESSDEDSTGKLNANDDGGANSKNSGGANSNDGGGTNLDDNAGADSEDEVDANLDGDGYGDSEDDADIDSNGFDGI
ncbi:hypothetical protein WN943_007273 [Citrus x changshan-huyou]